MLYLKKIAAKIGVRVDFSPFKFSSAPQPEKLLEIIGIMEKFQSHLFCTVSRELIVPV
jgi:hypothetical protein